MKKFGLLIMLPVLLVLFSCSEPAQDPQFESLANHYIEAVLKSNPEFATYLGDHRFDHLMNDYSAEAVGQALAMNRAYLDSLRQLDPARLSEVNRIDYQILRHNIKATIFSLDTLREHEWNPLYYNVGNGLYMLIAREFAPMEVRMKNLVSRLRAVPNVLDQCKINLLNPPKVYTETAILQNKGNISMIRDQLPEFIAQTPALQAEFDSVQAIAVEALEFYVAWLEGEMLGQSNGDFRLGDANYRKKLAYALESDYQKEVILERAEQDLAETQEVMYQTARELHQKYFPNISEKEISQDRAYVIKTVLDRLAQDQPTSANIFELARKSVEECTEFVRIHDLVTLPEEPLEVIVMPEFRRGFSVAYCDAPGPLEKNAKTFYAISPTPKDWSAERTASFYREYNIYMLHDLSIHEGTPGHYLQLAHANKFKAPTNVRAIFGSGTFVEGWGTYAEQLMAEFGFGGPEVRMQQLKMRLRLIINAIIDQKIHTAGMTREAAMDMMMNQGFQEEGEAAGKWRRACLSSTQLSTYYVGNLEVNDIRQAYEDKMGGEVNLKTLHDTMLSFGSPAPKYVKVLMGL
ncbi:MAG: DUF885 domain-containing protein [Calditrichaeota bacterium]|nr:DUF885 domain-containing protein [Calditrichota bacterium]MCB9089449.1 DUF885 domain-containing protein [Calditrichia bacterium]